MYPIEYVSPSIIPLRCGNLLLLSGGYVPPLALGVSAIIEDLLGMMDEKLFPQIERPPVNVELVTVDLEGVSCWQCPNSPLRPSLN